MSALDRCSAADFVLSDRRRLSRTRSTQTLHSPTLPTPELPTPSQTTVSSRRRSSATTRTVRTSLHSRREPPSLTLRHPSTATRPDCATAVVIWQHGTYAIHTNGSITLDPSPFAADGRVQVQDPCAENTNVLAYYAQWELFSAWEITIDVNHAAYALQLRKYDGSKAPR